MKKTKALIILFTVAAVIGIIGSVTLFYAMNYSFNPDINHFEPGSTAVIITSSVLAAVFLISSSAYIIAGKNIFIKKNEKSHVFLNSFVSAFAACVTLFAGIYGVVGGMPDTKPVIFIVRTAFTFLSAVFFAAQAFGLFEKKPQAAVSALVPAVMLAFSILYTYFDPEVSMNSTSKTYEIIMLVSFMLYFKDSAGCAVSRAGIYRKYLFSGIFASSAGATVALAGFFSSFMYGNGLNLSVISTGFNLVIWIYIIIDFIQNTVNICEKNGDGSLTVQEADTSPEDENIPDAGENNEYGEPDADEDEALGKGEGADGEGNDDSTPKQ